MDNIFTTNYSTSNPFSMDTKTPSGLSQLDGSLAQAYQKLEEMKRKQSQIDTLSANFRQAQQPTTRTVFTDIADEFNVV